MKDQVGSDPVFEPLLEFLGKTTGVAIEVLSDASSLFETQRLDSLALIQLIAFLEDQFQIRIQPSELSSANFDSVTKIAGYVKRKVASRA